MLRSISDQITFRSAVVKPIVYTGNAAAKRPFHPLFTSIQANGRRGRNPECIERIAADR